MRRTLLRSAVLILLFCFSITVVAQNPVADPKSVVVSGEARFTVLTPRLIRMEWSADRRFEDRASIVFIHRKLAVPKFESQARDGWLTLRTDAVTLRYKVGTGRFTPENLNVSFDLNGAAATWRPGMEDRGNLRGTTRTLDGVRGATSLEPGLISRDGWVVVDDSATPVFDGSDWPWAVARGDGERQDWYLFAYGHDYKDALRDFTQVAGKIPLPPRFAFGTWWSRYWAYTDRELRELVQGFQQHDIPLDVLVIDMDWHLTFEGRHDEKDQSGHRLGWTGYTWNRTFFPDPAAFLNWVHGQGLKATLNLHPASGVQPHEEQYPEMARAMGIDPATKNYVPFDIASKKFAENYLKILHHPMERQGVDFWWLDWQQEHKTKLPGVNPTWWLNYVHFTDMERRGKRGLLFHRWGGLGNHRYQIGFSGDTVSVWDSLAFQPYFTATAANVGYGYWSHDIGGHQPGVVGPELYTRWIQFGVFSPVLRTHTTKNPDAERRIWAYPLPYSDVMRRAYLLRYALVPYTYTMARNAHDTGLAICRAMYYEYPETNEAYDSPAQYMFGDDLIVAPVTTPVDETSQLATQSVWLPAGSWTEWSTGARLNGPAKVQRTFALGEYPVYVREGAIIPMAPSMQTTSAKPLDPLILNIYPGQDGSTRVYEDAGNTPGYKSGEFTWTPVKMTRNANTTRVTIGPAEGSFSGMVKDRAYELRLISEWPARSVTVNGRPLAPEQVRYDGYSMTTIIAVPRTSTRQVVEVVVQQDAALTAQRRQLEGVPGTLSRLRYAMDTLNGSAAWSPEVLVEATQAGQRMTLRPETGHAEVQKLRESLPQIVRAIESMKIDRARVDRALGHLSGVYDARAAAAR